MSARLVAALALVPTPLLLFLSPAVQLYAGNVEDLHYQSSVILPFVWLTLAAGGIGALGWALSGARLFRYLTWAYLLVAPFLLSFRFLVGAASELPSLLGLAVAWSHETAGGLVLWGLAWLAISLACARRFQPRAIAKPMAAFAIVVLGGDVLALASARRPAPSSEATLRTVRAPSTGASAANVYHIVLDELQTDVLELIRGPELDASFGGFAYFPNNETIYHATVMSLSSVFSGRRYEYDEPRGRYIESGFGERSFVARFADAGYWTLAVVPGSDPIEPGSSAFEHVFLHAENFERSSTTNAAAFENLWIVANVPPVVLDFLSARRLLSERTLAQLRLTRAGRALTDSAPVASAMSFRELVAAEPELPDAGRYTFVHLLIPHSPYVLRDDCGYREWERAEDPIAQTRCTMALVAKLLDAIETSGRFEGALIVIHGDHGAPFRMRGGELVRSRARSSSTPLLIKPPGRSRKQPFVECERASTLLDVAPTVIELADLPRAPEHVGTSLAPAIETCTR